jgi:hypothetical protein
LKPFGGMRTQFEPSDRPSIARPIPPHPFFSRGFEPSGSSRQTGRLSDQSLPIRHSAVRRLKPFGGMRTQFEPLDRSSNARPIPPHPPSSLMI